MTVVAASTSPETSFATQAAFTSVPVAGEPALPEELGSTVVIAAQSDYLANGNNLRASARCAGTVGKDGRTVYVPSNCLPYAVNKKGKQTRRVLPLVVGTLEAEPQIRFTDKVQHSGARALKAPGECAEPQDADLAQCNRYNTPFANGGSRLSKVILASPFNNLSPAVAARKKDLQSGLLCKVVTVDPSTGEARRGTERMLNFRGKYTATVSYEGNANNGEADIHPGATGASLYIDDPGRPDLKGKYVGSSVSNRANGGPNAGAVYLRP